MVFWKTYPIQNIIKRLQNRDIFTDLQFERDSIKSPTGCKFEILNISDSNSLQEIQSFIKTHFGSPPTTPILDIPVDTLLGEKDIILYVRDKTGIIAGCVRYHYLGNFISSNDEDIYCEDCFCIHPNWRKKGVGDYLLTQLHIYVNKNNIPYSMFLKEGPPLSISNIPFYSGLYVYKKVEPTTQSNKIINLSIPSAYKLIDIFRQFNNTFIIRNEKSNNQVWKLYKKDIHSILVCFQDTYQHIEENNKKQKIGWATAWFESSELPDNIREEASNILANSMYKKFDYIWMNKVWVNNYGKGTNWKIDGPFHWYLYQWTSSISIKKNYCILT
jgi:GNAT superfamily N-acetyltransferase